MRYLIAFAVLAVFATPALAAGQVVDGPVVITVTPLAGPVGITVDGVPTPRAAPRRTTPRPQPAPSNTARCTVKNTGDSIRISHCNPL